MTEITFGEYDPAWGEQFNREAERLRAALGDVASAIEHVGSTAIPGMPGKGIIDIMVSVRSLEPEDAYTQPLERLGYIRRPIPERPESPFFTRPETRPRSHNVHVVVEGSIRQRSLRAFRDYLRKHSDDATAYEAIKRQIVSGTGRDHDAYSAGKRALAAEIERRALVWANTQE